jgi:hypothetical protein
LFVFACIIALAFLGGAAGSSAGIQGSGRQVLARGSVTAFGSIFVDGVEYEISSALITIDGKPATASQLELGQIVTVQGNENGNSGKGTASSVSFTGNVIGPVSSIDIAASSLTVLGQTVRVDDSTLFGAGIQPASLAGMQPGGSVEISAVEDASGNLHASRIDLQAGSSPLQVVGTIAALDPVAQTFRVNDLVVDYSGVQVVGTLANGSTASIQALSPPAGAPSLLYASQVQVSQGLGGGAGEQGRMDGLITSLASNQSFSVGDQQVWTNSSTQFVLHGQTLAPNLAVRVHGAFTASGVLLADQIEARPPQAGGGSAGSAKNGN